MTFTTRLRTIARGKPLVKPTPHKVAISANWTTMASWQVTAIGTETNWHANVSADLDVDPGTTAQFRLRVSSGTSSTPTVLTAPTFRQLLGWTAIPNAPARVFLEARITAGAGGARCLAAQTMAMSFPPGYVPPVITATTSAGFFVTPTNALTHTINTTSLSTAPVAGDRILWIIAAGGPSAAAAMTYTHPGTVLFDAPGQLFRPRLRGVLVTFAAQASFAFTGTSNIRVAGVVLKNAVTVTAGAPAYATTPVNAAGVANTANSLGIAVTALNFTNGSVTAPPAGHTTILNSVLGSNQIHIATLALGSAGTYDPAAATVGPSAEQGTAIAIAAGPT